MLVSNLSTARDSNDLVGGEGLPGDSYLEGFRDLNRMSILNCLVECVPLTGNDSASCFFDPPGKGTIHYWEHMMLSQRGDAPQQSNVSSKIFPIWNGRSCVEISGIGLERHPEAPEALVPVLGNWCLRVSGVLTSTSVPGLEVICADAPTVVPEQLLSLYRAYCLQRDSGSGIMPNASKWVPQGLMGFMTCPMALLCNNHLASDLAS